MPLSLGHRVKKTPFLVAFVLTSVIGLPAILTTQPAAALDPVSCMDVPNPIHDDGDYGQIVGYEDDGSTYDDLRGLWTEIKVTTSVACQRVASINLLAATFDGTFEFGFISGHLDDPFCNYPGPSSSTPILFNFRKATNGAVSCKVFSSVVPTPGDYEDFQVYHYADGWASSWEGQDLQPSRVQLGYALGYGQVNMERGGVHDRCEAYFRFINEYHNANGWTYTEDLSQLWDYDISCNFTTPDEHTVHIVP